jgi:hypothetical protein
MRNSTSKKSVLLTVETNMERGLNLKYLKKKIAYKALSIKKKRDSIKTCYTRDCSTCTEATGRKLEHWSHYLQPKKCDK